MERIFYVDEIKKLINQYDKEEITLSRFVEILNEKATGKKAVKLHKPESRYEQQQRLAIKAFFDRINF